MPTRKKQFRTKRANGRLVVDGRSSRGRRLAELTEAYSIGLPDDETARGLVASVARLQVEIEAIEDKIDRKQPVDHEVFTKMLNTRQRSFEQIRECKAQARPSIGHEHAPGPGGWSNALARHLHWMVWSRDRCGDANLPQGKLCDELTAEYAELERQGKFVGAEVNGYRCGPLSS
jgi:hypothetical protein